MLQFCVISLIRMKILWRKRMIVDLLLMILMWMALMLVWAGEKRRWLTLLLENNIIMVSVWTRTATLMNWLFQKSSKKEASSSKPPVKKKQKSVSDEGSQKKKRKKKKDPNAPKRAIAPFMYFSKAERAVSFFKSWTLKCCNADKIG